MVPTKSDKIKFYLSFILLGFIAFGIWLLLEYFIIFKDISPLLKGLSMFLFAVLYLKFVIEKFPYKDTIYNAYDLRYKLTAGTFFICTTIEWILRYVMKIL